MQNRFRPYNKSLFINILMNNKYKTICVDKTIPNCYDINKLPNWEITVREINITRLLLSHPSVDVNIKDSFNNSMLYYSCGKNNDINIVKLLLEHPNIDINAQNQNGFTALIHTCKYSKYNNMIAMKLLLQQPKIDVNIQDEDGWTALMYSCDRWNFRAIELLLEDITNHCS